MRNRVRTVKDDIKVNEGSLIVETTEGLGERKRVEGQNHARELVDVSVFRMSGGARRC